MLSPVCISLGFVSSLLARPVSVPFGVSGGAVVFAVRPMRKNFSLLSD